MPTTIVRTWTTSFTNVPSQTTLDAQGKAVLFALKTYYLAAGWTVDGSSDGSTANMTGTDLWVTAANIIWAGAGVAHSWIVLKSPSGMLPNSKFVYHCYKCSTGATQQHTINIAHGTAVFTGGTNIADPTSPTGVATYANKQFLKSSTVANSKYHLWRNTVGDVLMGVSGDGSGFVHSLIGCLTPTGYPSAANYPCINIASYNGSSPGAGLQNQLNLSTHCGVFTQAGILPTSTSGLLQYYTNFGPGPIGGTTPLAGNAVDNTYFGLPAIVFYHSSGAALQQILGTLVDVAIGPESTLVSYPSVEPATGTAITVLVGGLWLPCAGSGVPNFL